MNRFIQTLIFLLLTTHLCFAQWNWQNPLPTGCVLNDICFIDANIGFAVGECGTILKTTDSGENWAIQSGFENYNFTAVQFSDANTGIVVGFELNNTGLISIILRTKDGGNNWNKKTFEVNSGFTDVHFTDADNGTVVGRPILMGFGTILRTTDGGENWLVQLCDSTNGWSFNGVYFKDADNGMVVGRDAWNGEILINESIILTTGDGGKNWIKQNCEIKESLNKVHFVNDSIGWIVGGYGYGDSNGIILKTTDGGNRWIRQTTNILTSGLYDVCFTDVNNGIVIGFNWKAANSGIILRTIDGGINWIVQSIPIKGQLKGVSFNGNSTMIVVGTNNDYSGGIILRTTNGGVTFIDEQVINETPTGFLLEQNYPNPFNSNTKIKYSISKSSNVTLKVFDIHGKTIDILVNEEKPAGTCEVTWYAGNLPGGVYFYQLNTGGLIETRKMILRR